MQLSRRSLLAGGMAATAAPQTASPAPEPSSPAQRNLIVIVLDTLGANWLGCYGNESIHTPHIDALASRSARFTSVFGENLPTIPARRTLYTGRRTFPSMRVAQPGDRVPVRGWHQLYAEDETLSETLQSLGYTTALVSDVHHHFKPGKNFHRGFAAVRWVRGQETDAYETGPLSSIPLLDNLHPSQVKATLGWTPKRRIAQYLLNRRDWKTEEDWFTPRVFGEATKWLKRNVELETPLYLHIESFSPHEFWDPPEDYYRKYLKVNYSGPRLVFPPPWEKEMTAAEIAHSKALYAGYVTFVDTYIGKFLQEVESLGLMKNSIIALLGDHGTMMGEQGQFHKSEPRIRTQVTRVPLLIYHPDRPWAGRTVNGFVQHTDLAPTLLDALGEKPAERMTGRSLVKQVETGGGDPDWIVIGWGEHASLRTPEWDYIGTWIGNRSDELYDLKKDPEELRNVAADHPRIVEDLRRKMLAYIDGGWVITKGTFASILEA